MSCAGCGWELPKERELWHGDNENPRCGFCCEDIDCQLQRLTAKPKPSTDALRLAQGRYPL